MRSALMRIVRLSIQLQMPSRRERELPALRNLKKSFVSESSLEDMKFDYTAGKGERNCE
jgi:hypothetical protein